MKTPDSNMNTGKRIIISTLIAFLVISPVFSEPKKSTNTDPDPSKFFLGAIDQLLKAKRFEDQVTGESGIQSVTYKSFKRLASSKIAINELERLVKVATPAGKIYAAAAISEIDYAKGKNAYKKLLSDNSDVDYKSGCKVCSFKVGEIAKSLLDTGAFLNFKTSHYQKKKKTK